MRALACLTDKCDILLVVVVLNRVMYGSRCNYEFGNLENGTVPKVNHLKTEVWLYMLYMISLYFTSYCKDSSCFTAFQIWKTYSPAVWWWRTARGWNWYLPLGKDQGHSSAFQRTQLPHILPGNITRILQKSGFVLSNINRKCLYLNMCSVVDSQNFCVGRL